MRRLGTNNKVNGNAGEHRDRRDRLASNLCLPSASWGGLRHQATLSRRREEEEAKNKNRRKKEAAGMKCLYPELTSARATSSGGRSGESSHHYMYRLCTRVEKFVESQKVDISVENVRICLEAYEEMESGWSTSFIELQAREESKSRNPQCRSKSSKQVETTPCSNREGTPDSSIHRDDLAHGAIIIRQTPAHRIAMAQPDADRSPVFRVGKETGRQSESASIPHRVLFPLSKSPRPYQGQSAVRANEIPRMADQRYAAKDLWNRDDTTQATPPKSIYTRKVLFQRPLSFHLDKN
ncbi:hypothetical protein EMPG_17249 [Blastomyces silverae]|uniref:Uncharacterized protein n=1 Tax=Blastomyces silverae TaxID=2060906 RepID=A0A0H1B849_9EURO|nr:hypothetical protein EMPG_17249 [Blastomyces silverae]